MAAQVFDQETLDDSPATIVASKGEKGSNDAEEIPACLWCVLVVHVCTPPNITPKTAEN